MKKDVNKYYYGIEQIFADKYIGKVYERQNGFLGLFPKLKFIGCIQYIPPDENTSSLYKDMWKYHLWTTLDGIVKQAIHSDVQKLTQQLEEYVGLLNNVYNCVDE